MEEKKLLSLDEIKKIELNILIEFDKFCKKYDLKYSLSYGTLLGSVRHKGFIPWDDDIDLMMTRTQYDRLIEIVKNEKIADYIDCEALENSDTIYPFIKLYDNRTMVDCPNSPLKKGIWIDIFPLDKLDINKSAITYKKIRVLRKLLAAKMIQRPVTTKLNFVIRYIAKIFLLPIPMRWFTRKIDKIAHSFKNTKSDYISIICWGTKNDIYDSAFMDEYTDLEFEGHKFSAAKNYIDFLVKDYGDYMKLPPEDKRICHYMKAWKL